jgi:5-methylcytosine-specific restriction endonuclease McrA
MSKSKNFKSEFPCVVCGLTGDGLVTYHHLKTQKAHGEYKRESWNMISACQEHHNEFHNKPLTSMVNKYSNVKTWLIENGWELCEVLFKWRHY